MSNFDEHDDVQEKRPPQPTCPELHKNEPANSPYRRWFENRGYSYEKGEWETRPPE